MVTMSSKRKLTKMEQRVAIKAARGGLRVGPKNVSFVERMTKLKNEDREIERRRDERLAALIGK